MSEDFILFLIPYIVILLWVLAVAAVVWGAVVLVKKLKNKKNDK